MKIEEAKNRLRLPELCRQLGITATIPDRDGLSVPCFWPDRHSHGDRRPSFNFYDGLRRFKCFACGRDGDGPDLVGLMLGRCNKEAIKVFLEMAEQIAPSPASPPISPQRATCRPPLEPGSEEDLQALAELRRINPDAVRLARDLGVLRFAHQFGSRVWVVTDRSCRAIEARRLDGQRFPALGRLSERKSHAFKGSTKSWPVGILPLHRHPERFAKVLLCEGGPDLLAAYHFCLQLGVDDALPVALLGRSTAKIHPDALPHFSGRQVRIFPHADPDGGGLRAAKRWHDQIEMTGASAIDYFDFSGLRRRDGSPVNDLNDCTDIHPDFLSELQNLIP